MYLICSEGSHPCSTAPARLSRIVRFVNRPYIRRGFFSLCRLRFHKNSRHGSSFMPNTARRPRSEAVIHASSSEIIDSSRGNTQVATSEPHGRKPHQAEIGESISTTVAIFPLLDCARS
jgi:hypothetical protein